MEFNATFIISFISFIIFIIIMNLILYKPINNIIEKRQKFIDENYNEANQNNEQSKNILEEKNKQIKQAHNNAKEKYNLANINAKEKKTQSIYYAKEQSKVDIEENIIDFNNQSNNAKNILKNDIIFLAQMICDKFIQSEDKVNIQDELINKIMQG